MIPTSDHPNLARIRRARLALDMAERMFRAEIDRSVRDREGYTMDAVAKAANVSRQRVYQILGEMRERAHA